MKNELFSSPESSAAKSLVKQLISHHPEDRPSADQICKHQFFMVRKELFLHSKIFFKKRERLDLFF